MSRKWRLALVLGLAFPGFAISAATTADEYPTRPVRMLIGYPAGGPTDFVAQLMATRYAESLKEPFVVESRPGGNGTIAANLTAKAPPDGYTLNLANVASLVIAPAVAKIPYDPLQDLAPVSQVVSMPNVLMVHAASPVATLDQFVTLAKQKPGMLAYTIAGGGMPGKLAGKLFMHMAKIDMLKVKHTGRSAALDALSSGRIQLLVAAAPTALPLVKAGKARALAVTGGKRMPAIPGVPTVAEAGIPGYEATNWYGIVVPAGTPQRIIDRLHKETAGILARPEIERALDSQGIEVAPSLPEQFLAYIKSETSKWTKAVQVIGQQADGR